MDLNISIGHRSVKFAKINFTCLATCSMNGNCCCAVSPITLVSVHSNCCLCTFRKSCLQLELRTLLIIKRKNRDYGGHKFSGPLKDNFGVRTTFSSTEFQSSFAKFQTKSAPGVRPNFFARPCHVLTIHAEQNVGSGFVAILQNCREQHPSILVGQGHMPQ